MMWNYYLIRILKLEVFITGKPPPDGILSFISNWDLGCMPSLFIVYRKVHQSAIFYQTKIVQYTCNSFS